MKDILEFTREYNGCEKYNNEMLSYIFCEIAYFDFSKYNNLGIRNHMIPLSILKRVEVESETIEGKVWHSLLDNEAFSNLKVGYFHEVLNVPKSVQFAAVTMEYKGVNYICYRGTDINLTGWKEDIDLGYEEVIPSQTEGLRYLNKIASSLKGDIVVSGHSKGGNVAVYASANTTDKIRTRIHSIFSFDGVGFRQSFYNSKEYASIREKVVKFIPRHSFVGLLFGNDRRTTLKVIDADGIGFNQHGLENWKIRNNAFVLHNRVADYNRKLAKNVNIWIFNLKKPEARKLINTLYDIASDCGIIEMKDVSKRFMFFTHRTLKRYFGSNQSSRKESNRILGDFLSAVTAW